MKIKRQPEQPLPITTIRSPDTAAVSSTHSHADEEDKRTSEIEALDSQKVHRSIAMLMSALIGSIRPKVATQQSLANRPEQRSHDPNEENNPTIP